MYFGDIGKDSCVLRDYFASNGAVCPPNANPAEYMLEAIGWFKIFRGWGILIGVPGAGTTPRIGDQDWKDIWLGSPQCQKLQNDIASIKSQALAQPEPDKKSQSTCQYCESSKHHVLNLYCIPDATPFLYQLRIVTARNNLALWRSPDYLFSRLFVCGFISLFVSLSFLQLGTSLRDLQFRVFSIFWVSILPVGFFSLFSFSFSN